MGEASGVGRWTCLVCQAPSNMYYYGVRICRGCACFYKRWFKDQRKYVCKSGSYTCEVRYFDPLSARCKACRLLNCLKAGLPGEDPTPSPPSENLTAVSCTLNNFKSGTTAVCSRLTQAYYDLHEFQKASVQRLHPYVDFGRTGPVLATKWSLMTISNQAVPAFMNILCGYISPLGFTSGHTRTTLAVDTQFELHVMNEFYMTSQCFPRIGDTRLAVMPGLWADIVGSVDEFWFDENMDPNDKRLFLNIINPYNKKYLKMINMFKRCKLSAMDICIMMLLALCKYCENFRQLSVGMEAFKDRVMAEYSENLRENFKEKSYERLSTVLLLYDQFIKFSIESTDLQEQLDLLRSSGAKLADSLPCTQSMYDGK